MKTRVQIAAVFVFTIICTIGAAAQQPCERHAEPTGGFSVCMPAGWTKVLRDGRKYHNLHAPPEPYFRTNINFRDDPTRSTLAKYVADSLAYMATSPIEPDATPTKVVSQTPFKTKSGLDGIRVVTNTTIKTTTYRFTQYFFKPDASRVLFITGTSLDTSKDQWEPIFDDLAASFRMDK